jgi:hypothetical protein
MCLDWSLQLRFYKALGKLGNIVAETLFPANVSPCFSEWANTRKH